MTSRMRFRPTTAFTFVTTLLGGMALLDRPAFAQNPHPDVAPRVQNGQVVTGGINDANNQFTPNLRVFDFVFGQDDPTQPYFDSDPGWRAEPYPGFPSTGFTPGKNLDLLGRHGESTLWPGAERRDAAIGSERRLGRRDRRQRQRVHPRLQHWHV